MGNLGIRYRKMLGLLITFLVLVTMLFVTATFFARTMTVTFVETDFNNKKVEVFDEFIKPFNEFFTEKVPEISYYQGYIDSAQAAEFSNTVFRLYPFVSNVNFFDVVFTNRDSLGKGLRFNHLGISSRNAYSFKIGKDNQFVSLHQSSDDYKNNAEEFNNMMLKLAGFLDRVSESTRLTDNDIYKVFYTLQPGKISYLNIPRMSDIMAYKSMMSIENLPKSDYEQDLFVFSIEPRKMTIRNKYPNLYEDIVIKPVVDQYTVEDEAYLRTELALPGAMSDYKLQFDASQDFIRQDVNRRFFPVLLGLLLIYVILLTVGYLVYRNFMINSRLYQLQYDFINNLTHEFKTPVSVIKIAGNNIKSADNLSDTERNMYGRILDQEADKLNALMNKLLSFAQIENKSIKFNGEYIELNEFCQHIFDGVHIKYPDLKLSYTIDVTTEMFADPVLLTSVFQNLIDNAYKYSAPNRKVLDISVQQNKRNFVLVFKDQGIGIDKKEFNSVFKKFYRVKNQFNQQGSIGLGLAFCKEITEFMNGEIKVDSQLNVGTVFTLSFPIEHKKS